VRAGRVAAAALVLAAALSACSRTRKADKPDTGEAGPPKAEAPDRPSEKGVPPKEGRPRVPAAP
jgi:hypothetical protein